MTRFINFLFGWLLKSEVSNKFFKWFVGSFQENGIASGKAFCSFSSMLLIIYLVVDEARHKVSHTETLMILTGFILSLYSVKAVTKYFNTSGNNTTEQK